MCAYRLAGRVILLIVIFFGVGFGTSHAIIQHEVANGAKLYNVRLAGLMSGLFAGGLVTVLVGLAMLLSGKGKSAPDHGRQG